MKPLVLKEESLLQMQQYDDAITFAAPRQVLCADLFGDLAFCALLRFEALHTACDVLELSLVRSSGDAEDPLR